MATEAIDAEEARKMDEFVRTGPRDKRILIGMLRMSSDYFYSYVEDNWLKKKKSERLRGMIRKLHERGRFDNKRFEDVLQEATAEAKIEQAKELAEKYEDRKKAFAAVTRSLTLAKECGIVIKFGSGECRILDIDIPAKKLIVGRLAASEWLQRPSEFSFSSKFRHPPFEANSNTSSYGEQYLQIGQYMYGWKFTLPPDFKQQVTAFMQERFMTELRRSRTPIPETILQTYEDMFKLKNVDVGF
jgi:hypothetical protein